MRVRSAKTIGYLKNATVYFLTVAFLASWLCRASILPASAAEPDPAALLLEGLTTCAAVIDLTHASLPVSELGRVYHGLLLDNPELFHVALRLSYGYTETGGVRAVTEVYPTYTLTGDDLTAARALYRDTVAGILTEMDAAFGDCPRTEADTVLFLHDLLADRYAYDTRADSPNADAYTFLRDGRGVCQAYALAFTALCRGAGVEAHLVTSDAMNHAWNHVRADGVWYHVDVTRDDPIPAAEGREQVNHARLLRSDVGMDALGYHGYACAEGHACTDTRYEDPHGGALAAFSQKLLFSGGKWLGVDESGGIVAVKCQNDGFFVGQVGDADLNGQLDPADLLALYDPALPEAWRAWTRERLTKTKGT